MPVRPDESDRPRVDTLKGILADEFQVPIQSISEEDRDIGRGYSVEAVLFGLDPDAILLGLGLAKLGKDLFFRGKEIEENLEAWLRIGQKLRNVFRRAKAMEDPPQLLMDKNFAKAMAMVLASEGKDRPNIVVIAEHDIPVQPPYWETDAEQGFSANTERLYIFVVQVDGDTHLIALCSNGKVAVNERIPTSNYMDFHYYWSDDDGR